MGLDTLVGDEQLLEGGGLYAELYRTQFESQGEVAVVAD